jgi:manganese/zinc/iron transport system permease protein
MYFNPYSDQDFFGFFGIFFSRLFLFFTGKLPFEALVADEVQMIVLACVAVTGALVGTFLVLRRMTMLANALSHTILLGIVVAYLICETLTIPTLMIAALTTGIVTTFLTEFLNRVIKLQEDASIGLVFSVLFALGIVLLTLFSRNVHIGTELVMGNVDALQRGDIGIVASVLGINALFFLLLYYGFKITTFDPNLARAFGFSPLFFNYLLMVQTSATAVGAFRAVGVLMVMAFFVLPPLTARLLTHRLPTLIGLSATIGAVASLVGVALSRHILTFCGVGLSTGGIVVIVLGLFYIGALATKRALLSPARSAHLLSGRKKEQEIFHIPVEE